MGMDVVEIIVRTENAFGIKIPDAAATNLTTPRELADFVASKVSLSDGASCLSQQSFYYLREHFQAHLSFSRHEFRPATPLEKLVPKQNRQLIWARLQAEIGENALPDLARPVWLFWSLTLLTVFIFFYTMMAIWYASRVGMSISIFSGAVIAFCFAILSSVLTLPTREHFKRDYKCVGEIASFLIANKPQAFKRSERRWTRAQILETVRAVVADYTDSPDFSDDADFVNDLHLD